MFKSLAERTVTKMACLDPIESHYRLVPYVAKRFLGVASAKGESFEDIVQSGYIGLLYAHRTFDPDMSIKFSTYAISVIIRTIRNHLRDQGGRVYIPRPIRDYVDRIHRLGLHDESAEVIAEKFNITLRWAKRTLAALHAIQTYSLDRPAYLDGKPVNLYDYHVCESDFSSAVVNDFLDTLPPRERTILQMYMSGRRQHEIGQHVSLGQVAVSRTLKRIGIKLKQYLEGDDLHERSS